MKNKKLIILIIAFALNLNISFAAALGTPEIIILLVVGILSISFIGGVFAIIYAFAKRKSNSQNTLEINISPQPQPSISVSDKQNANAEISVAKIALPQQYEIRYVNSNEICRCEADNNYTNFYFLDGEKLLISKSLKEYSDLLKTHGFVRAHQSHLVNPRFVKSWLKEDGGTLLMNNGDKIPVSKPNREIVKAVLGK